MNSKTTRILTLLWLTLALASLPALRAQPETPPATPAPTEQATPPAKAIDADKPAPAAEAPAAAAPPAADETKPAAGDAKQVEEKSAEPGKTRARRKEVQANPRPQCIGGP